MRTRQGMQSISTCAKMFWELWNKIFLNIFLFWTREHSPFYHLHSSGIETYMAHLSYACNSKQIAAGKPFSMAVIFHFTDREKALCETFFGNPHFLPSYLFKYENIMRWFFFCALTVLACRCHNYIYFWWVGGKKKKRYPTAQRQFKHPPSV